MGTDGDHDVVVVSDTSVLIDLEYRKRVPTLSLPDCFALALAVGDHWTLLTGDAELRGLAEACQVECHGLLWLLDRMLDTGAATSQALHAGLVAISEHPRCRLPRAEVRERLKGFGGGA